MESGYRRENDRKSNMVRNLMVYGSLAGAISTILALLSYSAAAYSKLTIALTTAPLNTERIERLERWKLEQEEATYNIQWWMAQMGKRMNIPAPPPHSRRFSQENRED